MAEYNPLRRPNAPVNIYKRQLWNRVGLALSLLALAACGPLIPTATPTPAPTLTPTITPTPTPTPIPLAARVNGRAITVPEYEREVQRCQAGRAAAGAASADCPPTVLQSLIEQVAVEQAAAGAGLSVSEAEAQAQLDQIAVDLGGPDAFSAWLADNLYTEDELRDALRRDMLRAKMTQQVTAPVDERAEQVHARQILMADEATAQSVLELLQNGADFATLATAYSLDLSSRPAGGDLGWFPRGLLTAPEVEAAAFSLQPGETSAVIQSALGYHIVQVLERQPARELSPGALQALRTRAYQTWLDRLLAQTQVEKFITP